MEGEVGEGTLMAWNYIKGRALLLFFPLKEDPEGSKPPASQIAFLPFEFNSVFGWGPVLFADDRDGGKMLQGDPGDPVIYWISVESFPSPQTRDEAVIKTDGGQCSPGAYRLAEGGMPWTKDCMNV